MTLRLGGQDKVIDVDVGVGQRRWTTQCRAGTSQARRSVRERRRGVSWRREREGFKWM